MIQVSFDGITWKVLGPGGNVGLYPFSRTAVSVPSSAASPPTSPFQFKIGDSVMAFPNFYGQVFRLPISGGDVYECIEDVTGSLCYYAEHELAAATRDPNYVINGMPANPLLNPDKLGTIAAAVIDSVRIKPSDMGKTCSCNASLVWYQPFKGERHQICEKCGKS